MTVKELKFVQPFDPTRATGKYAHFIHGKFLHIFIHQTSPRKYNAGAFCKGMWLSDWRGLSRRELDAKLARLPLLG